MAEYNDELMDHEYDGIREMDNNLPRWWLWLFYLTIIWGVLYFLYYHVFDIGYSSSEQYQSEVNPDFVRIGDAETKLLGVLPEYHSPYFNPAGDITPRMRLLKDIEETGPRVMMTAETDTTQYTATDDPGRLAEGKAIFIQNCASCHGNFGEGNIGPNLTDNYWLHGAGISAVVKSVTYGFPAKGMIPWRGTLKPEQIINVSSYVTTIHGSNPPNPKAPQGELVTDYE